MGDVGAYEGRLPEVYARGRALTAEAMSEWTKAFRRRLPDRRPLVFADVGSGTGDSPMPLQMRSADPFTALSRPAR
jgi:hypothetical protein